MHLLKLVLYPLIKFNQQFWKKDLPQPTMPRSAALKEEETIYKSPHRLYMHMMSYN